MVSTGFLTDLIANDLQASIFHGASFPAFPTNLYLALSRVNPNRQNAIPAPFTELTGSNYSRTLIACTSGNWTLNATGQAYNTLQITLPVPTAPWLTVFGWGLYDAPTGGTLWWCGNLPGLVFTTTSAPIIAAGALILQI